MGRHITLKCFIEKYLNNSEYIAIRTKKSCPVYIQLYIPGIVGCITIPLKSK